MMAVMAAGTAAAPVEHRRGGAGLTLLARAYNTTGQQLFGNSPPRRAISCSRRIPSARPCRWRCRVRARHRVEMMRVLSMRMSAEAIDMANAEVLSILNGYDHSTAPPGLPAGRDARRGAIARCGWRDMMNQCRYGLLLQGDRCVGAGTTPPSARLLAANALMLIKRGDLIIPGLYRGAQTKYAAEVFAGTSLDDRQRLGCPQDGGPDSQAAGSTRSQFSAVLLDAVYFKRAGHRWFDKKLTREEAFHLTRSEQAQVR